MNKDLLKEKDYSNIYVLSDLHGYYELFKKALKLIDLKKDDLLIINGDSCDRGQDSFQIYQEVLRLKKEGQQLIHIKGNHEKMFYDFVVHGNGREIWMRNGGQATLDSYPGSMEESREILDRHMEFIEGMPLIVETERYIIVHAGLHPWRALFEQEESDLLWIRDAFIGQSLKYINKMVVFGHTVNPGGRIKYFSNDTFAIDCGTYANHRLGILELISQDEFYVKL